MKTACIYHIIDLDGWMSAAIVKHHFNSVSKTDRVDFIGYNYGQPIPDLSDYDQVIMVDISLPMNIMTSLSHNLGENFIWLDHHISAIKEWDYVIELNPQSWILKGIRDTKFAACELTWQYFFPNEPIPEIVRLLGLYDSFRHKNTDEEQKVLEFQYGARQCISNYEEAYNYLIQCTRAKESEYWRLQAQVVVGSISEQGKAIYQYLCTEAKQVYKNGFEIKFHNPNIIEFFGFDGNKLKFICINKERFNPINFGIDYHKDGYDGCACFHYDGQRKLWAFSLYNDNGEVDCSVIAKQYGGGGHRGASGFVTKDLKGIIE